MPPPARTGSLSPPPELGLTLQMISARGQETEISSAKIARRRRGIERMIGVGNAVAPRHRRLRVKRTSIDEGNERNANQRRSGNGIARGIARGDGGSITRIATVAAEAGVAAAV